MYINGCKFRKKKEYMEINRGTIIGNNLSNLWRRILKKIKKDTALSFAANIYKGIRSLDFD
jgi:hypothetical protein